MNKPVMLTVAALLIVGSAYFLFKKKTKPVKTIFTFMGAPGSGKGTLAELAIKGLGYTSLSTGNLLREAVAQSTELGKEAQGYMQEGKLVPDTLVMSIINDWFNKNLSTVNTLILDGFPRTQNQATLFIELLKKFPDVSFRVLEITIPDEVIVERMANRLVCEKCQAPYSRKLLKDSSVCEKCGGTLIQRQDDKPETVRERLKVYEQTVSPMRNVYKKAGLQIDTIDAVSKTPDQLFEEFKQLVD